MANCRKFESLLGPYVDGELSNEEAAVVQSHLSECPHCTQEVKFIRSLGDATRQSIMEATSRVSFDGMWEKIESRLDSESVSTAGQTTTSDKIIIENNRRNRGHSSIIILEKWRARLGGVPTGAKVAAISALAAAVVLLLALIPDLLRFDTKHTDSPTLPPQISLTVVNDCLVNSIESEGGTVVVTRDSEEQTTVIWLLDESPAVTDQATQESIGNGREGSTEPAATSGAASDSARQRSNSISRQNGTDDSDVGKDDNTQDSTNDKPDPLKALDASEVMERFNNGSTTPDQEI